MARRKKKPQLPIVLPNQNMNQTELQVAHLTELETNPKYSLKVDPEDNYSLSPEHKQFIEYYIQFKNVGTVAELMGIDREVAKEYFRSYATQSEIRRINLALYQRQFATKLLTIDELGGYLSSMLTDEYVPHADKLSSSEKLRVVEMIIRLNELKKESMANPTIIIEKDINEQLKDLSVDALKKLISESSADKTNEKVELINKLNENDVLTTEEKAYLQTLSTTELLKLVNDISSHKGEKKDE